MAVAVGEGQSAELLVKGSLQILRNDHEACH